MSTLQFALLVVEAWIALVLFDLASIRGFGLVHTLVRRCPVAKSQPNERTVEQVCLAVEEACVWYMKRAYCLQRATVATWLLRRRGVGAELVIGYRPVPIDSHAWVEVDGRVVNDRQQYQKFFSVLDRL
jgi:Transglutaminase-like superfamily